MFTEIYTLLMKSSSTEPEIQILTGWFEKPKGIKERIKKIKRKFKYKG